MDRDSLIEAAKEAEQIANSVGEAFRPVLFKVALEKLISTGENRSRQDVAQKGLEIPPVEMPNGKDKTEVVKSILSAHLEVSDPERKIIEEEKTLEQSIFILNVVEKRFGVEDLTPQEISKILSGNFGVDTTPNAVSMAFKNVLGLYVNRRRGARGYAYSLTPAGRKHLGELIERYKVAV